MRKKFHILFFIFCMSLGSFAQQTPAYSQFVLNNYILNPAYAGTNLGLEAVVGNRLQWIGMPGAPITNFASIVFGHRKNFSYKGKHGFGFMAEDDRRGMFSSKSTYLSYAYHIRIFTGWNLAAGISAGLRQMALSNNLYDRNDPAFESLALRSFFLIYPDVIPGIRMYTKKLFIDASIRQLYKNSIEQGSHRIGTTGSTLDPTLVFMVKRKFLLGNNTWMLVPAVSMQTTIKNAPYVQANCMLFYDKKIGIGASVNGRSSASAIIQIRVVKNLIAGFAYDYSISRMRAAAANSFEVMLVFKQGGGGEEKENYSRRVANCPDFAF